MAGYLYIISRNQTPPVWLCTVSTIDTWPVNSLDQWTFRMAHCTIFWTATCQRSSSSNLTETTGSYGSPRAVLSNVIAINGGRLLKCDFKLHLKIQFLSFASDIPSSQCHKCLLGQHRAYFHHLLDGIDLEPGNEMSKVKDLAKRSQSWFIHATEQCVLNCADRRANATIF